MALQGIWNKYESNQDPDNFTTFEVTYPSDLDPSHPNYENRGVTEEQKTYAQIENLVESKEVYVIISNASIWKHKNLSGQVDTLLNYTYKIYNSSTEKENDFNSEIDSYTICDVEFEFEGETNAFIVAYNHLKTQRGFENLINA